MRQTWFALRSVKPGEVMIVPAPAVQASVSGTRQLWSKLKWPLLLACGFLIFVSASSIYLVISSQSNREMMNRALELENKLWGILAVVRVAESEQRGYLLTGDPKYLDVFHTTADSGHRAVAAVREAIVDNPAQQLVLTEIEPLVVRKFAELRETIRLHDAGDHVAALALVQTGEGHELTTKIRGAALRMMEQQRHVTARVTSNSISTNIWLLLVNLAGLALIVVLAAISVIMMRRTAGIELAESESRTHELRSIMNDRKDAEKRLAQMDARSRGLLQAAPEAMVVVDQRGGIVLLNLQAEKELGYRRDEFLGQKVTNIIPEGFAPRLLTDGVDVLAQQMVMGVDLTGRRKNGNEFPIEVMLSPLESGEGILVILDISLRKDAEKHLALMEARYHGLLEAAPDTMVVVNHTGEIVLLNLQAEKEFGYRRDELLGQNINKIIPERVAERLIANGPRSLLPMQIGTESLLTGRRKDGGEFPIEIMLSPLESAERILVIRDISVRRKTERLKDEFVATVSHELRTPLTSISGSLGLLAGQWASKLPESAARLLKIAHTNSQRLARLLNDILDIEKLESGHVVFNLSKVPLRSLVEHAIEDNRGFATSYGVQVRLDAGSADVDVNADPDRLAQVITNLLSNAIKFSPADREVLVAVERNADIVRLTVRDHGSGIPDDFKLHIFEKFAQADATNTRQKGGTGLGLSIVRQIVERLAGKVGFEDAPGGGTTFYVDLPVWDGRAGGEIDLDSDSASARILLCEDDQAVATIVRERLRRAGFAVDFAHTVTAALARTGATRYAAILVDRQLPDGDGIGLIVRLRAQAHTRDTPVIVLSGDPEQGRSDVRSSRLNVLRWLGKPIAFKPLIELLEAATTLPLRRRPRILHVDDDYDVLALVSQELGSMADVISADCAESALRTLATDRIDLVVLDVTLGEDSGLDLLPDLCDSSGNIIPVIIFSNHSADVPCDDQVDSTLSKMNSSLESLGGAVRDRLALMPSHLAKEVA
jgi:PAS domain S-box-containing protein